MEKIRLDDFSAGGECDLFHHGKVWDCLRRNNFEFHTGNLYGKGVSRNREVQHVPDYLGWL